MENMIDHGALSHNDLFCDECIEKNKKRNKEIWSHHGSPSPKEASEIAEENETYSIRECVRDLTKLGGTVLTKSGATKILKKLLMAQRCNNCGNRNYEDQR